ncbi:peptidase A24 [Rhodospirillum rubrum]|uniref:prepilin peptidase n=1 Tax=Rhodospirillum rubrum TaxID=1085 RepID=UPI0019065DB6|nr:A24 family peptidase [Rhodospirillum rubrum]MBK1664361.1 peptidase A24 [Rhodospirillum rubrum]MBK1676125.1 peptidase A24 [Rhodospirillum rubrum]
MGGGLGALAGLGAGGLAACLCASAAPPARRLSFTRAGTLAGVGSSCGIAFALLSPGTAALPYALGAALVGVALLLVIAVIDIDNGVIHDILVLPLALVLLVWRIALGDGALSPLLSGAIAFVLAQGLRLAYRAVRRREGLGAGDLGVIAAAGVALGPAEVPVFLMTAGVAGVAWGLASRRYGDHPFPFAPALAVGLVMAMLARLSTP